MQSMLALLVAMGSPRLNFLTRAAESGSTFCLLQKQHLVSPFWRKKFEWKRKCVCKRLASCAAVALVAPPYRPLSSLSDCCQRRRIRYRKSQSGDTKAKPAATLEKVVTSTPGMSRTRSYTTFSRSVGKTFYSRQHCCRKSRNGVTDLAPALLLKVCSDVPF